MPEPTICPEFAMDYKRLRQLRNYRFDPKVVLDVGASNAVWAGTCAQVFPEAEYFLVEPQKYPELYSFPPETRHHWIHQAVGRREKEVELNMPGGEGARYNAHVKASPRQDIARSFPVHQTTVDQLMEEGTIAPPQLVKLDVQGYELEVLEGATRLWETAKIFIVECSLYRYWDKSPVLEEVVAYFAGRDFHVCEISTECRVAPSDILSQIDLIFAPRSCRMSSVMAPDAYPAWTAPDVKSAPPNAPVTTPASSASLRV